MVFVVLLSLSFGLPETQRSLEPVSIMRTKSEKKLSGLQLEKGAGYHDRRRLHFQCTLWAENDVRQTKEDRRRTSILNSFCKVWLSDVPLLALGVAFAANEKLLKVVVESTLLVLLERTDALLARSTLEDNARKIYESMAD